MPSPASVAHSVLAFAVACLVSRAPAQAPAPADLVLRNGRIVTVDPELGTVHALAARGGRIVALGADAEASGLVGEQTRVIDLKGRLAIPGFIEGHGHFVGLGYSRQILDLTKVDNWDQIVAMVAAAVQRAKPGEWIVGRGWHQEKWSKRPEVHVRGFPTHDSLSAVSPDNPVALTHASGHASFFNQKAMELAGVTAATEDPPGGEIIKDGAGRPTGAFSETAAWLVARAQTAREARRSPGQRAADTRTQARLAADECLAKGITSFQDAGSDFETVDVLRKMAEEGQLGVRLWVMLRTSNALLAQRLAEYRLLDVGDHFLTVRALKRSIDGALGSRGAWLLEPYADAPDSRGLETSTVESVTETARLGLEHGFQVCVHAIGDRANREVLDIYEKVWAGRDGRALRWRIEHAQHIHPDDIPRFGELGVIASMQGIHCTSDAPYVVPRLGAERAAAGAYVWRKLLDGGAVVTNGTDAPVEDVDPIASFHATVTRRLKDGSTFHADQALTRMEALKSYTLDCAFAAFEEDQKGSLVPGKLADIVVLSRDILTVPENEIVDARVLYTIVGGKVAYDAAR